jgi:hypothetical protein
MMGTYLGGYGNDKGMASAVEEIIIIIIIIIIFLFVCLGECRGTMRVLGSAEETLWNTRQDRGER